MTNEDLLQELKDVGAYLKGHFLLTTGRHSDQFFLLARLTERPRVLSRWAERLQEQIAALGPVDAVVGPAVGGIIPAYAVAYALNGPKAIFAEKASDDTMIFRRGFTLSPGQNVVVVEDAVTTGASVGKVLDAVKATGATVKAVAALVDRTGGNPPWPLPFLSVLSLTVPSWSQDECPQCREGRELVSPKG